MAENERLAVLENQYTALQHDVTEIKADVKALVASQSSLAVALAVREAADQRGKQGQAAMGVWVRSMLPWLIAVAALVLAIVNTIVRFEAGP
jgi:hypothetical protein